MPEEETVNETAEITVSVRLVNGDPITFQIERSESERRNMGAAIETALNSNYVGVEVDGKLIIVPTHNIQTISISPAPDMMIKSVVRGARNLRRGKSKPSSEVRPLLGEASQFEQ